MVELRRPGLLLSFIGAFLTRRVRGRSIRGSMLRIVMIERRLKKSMEKGVVDGIELRDWKVQREWGRRPAISTPAERDGKRDCLFSISTTIPTTTVPTSTTTSTKRIWRKRSTAPSNNTCTTPNSHNSFRGPHLTRTFR